MAHFKASSDENIRQEFLNVLKYYFYRVNKVQKYVYLI